MLASARAGEDHWQVFAAFMRNLVDADATSLTLALAGEAQLLRQCQDPLLYAERRDYLKTIGTAAAAIDEARIVLVRARQLLLDATSESSPAKEG